MSKTLYLIRHGESVHNYDKQQIRKSTEEPSTLLTLDFWKSIGRNLVLNMNTDLTEVGEIQAQNQGNYLTLNNFFEEEQVEIILYSPLQRTKHTYELMFKDVSIPAEEEPLLMEKQFSEYLYLDLSNRADQLKEMLQGKSESSIVLIGHSRMFQKLINEKILIENGSVWKIELLEDGSWENLEELYAGGETLMNVLS